MAALFLSRRLTTTKILTPSSTFQHLLSPFLQNPIHPLPLHPISHPFSTFSEQKLPSNLISSLSEFLSITQQNPINPNISFIKYYSTSSPKPTSQFIDKPQIVNPNFTSPQTPDLKSFSSSTNSNSDENPKTPEFKHQEIVGPTVERDVSALANEMRQVLEGLMKTVFNTSKALAALGIFQLCFGAWINYTTHSSPFSEASIGSIFAFAFPCALAFMLRKALRPMGFFKKMEEQGRLQILTLSLQVAKSLEKFFHGVRGASWICVAGMSVALLYSALPK